MKITKPSFVQDVDWKLLCEKYDEKQLCKVIKKLEYDYPVQYLIGNVEFMNTTILVNPSVLIPRFETELLVDKLENYMKQNDFEKANILDLCTGSGCIGISLKKDFPKCNVTAVDNSYRALKVAKKNAKNNNVNINFLKKDILKKSKFKAKFSVLVSNPPYVKLEEEVSPNTRFEPQKALYPGKDDLIFYKKIIDMSTNLLYKKNIIAFEIGSTQAYDICKYAKRIYRNAKIDVEQDYNGYDRYIFIFNNCE